MMFDKRVGDYTVDAGCDRLEFVVDQQNVCNFMLIKNAGSPDWEWADYDDVHMTMRPLDGGEGTIEGTMPAQPQSMTYLAPFAFTRTGPYAMQIRFLKDDTVLTEAEFPVTVLGGASTGARMTMALSVAGSMSMFVILAAIGLWAWLSRKRA